MNGLEKKNGMNKILYGTIKKKKKKKTEKKKEKKRNKLLKILSTPILTNSASL